MEETTADKSSSQHEHQGQHLTMDDHKPRSDDNSQYGKHGLNPTMDDPKPRSDVNMQHDPCGHYNNIDDSKPRSDYNSQHGHHGQNITMDGPNSGSDDNNELGQNIATDDSKLRSVDNNELGQNITVEEPQPRSDDGGQHDHCGQYNNMDDSKLGSDDNNEHDHHDEQRYTMHEPNSRSDDNKQRCHHGQNNNMDDSILYSDDNSQLGHHGQNNTTDDSTLRSDNNGQHGHHGQNNTKDDSTLRSDDNFQHEHHGQNNTKDDSTLRSYDNSQHGHHGQNNTTDGYKPRSDKNKRVWCSDCSSIYNSETCLSNCWLPNVKVAFQCDKCEKLFKSVELLNDHKLTHGSEIPFLCDLCGEGFSSNELFTNHLDTHKLDLNNRELSCYECGTVFESFASFASHQHKHRIGAFFTCQECGKGYAKKYNLDGHMLTHKGDEPYTCDLCGEEFAHEYLLEYHIRKHMGVFICKVCRKVTSTGRALKIHMLSHANVKPIKQRQNNSRKCEFCDRTFSYKGAFEKHNKIHIGENAWKCVTCSELFADKNLLEKHKKSHRVTKLPTQRKKSHAVRMPTQQMESLQVTMPECNDCKDKFIDNFYLILHKKVHVAKNRWECNDCGKIVLSKGLLLKHKYVRHDKRELRFDRDGTDLQLKRKSMKDLTSAYSISKCLKCETVDCPHTHVCFRCKMCGYKIAKGYNVRSHLLLHNAKDVHSYVCVRCDRPFSTKKGLEIHSRTSRCRIILKRSMTPKSRLALLHQKYDQMENQEHNLKGKHDPYKKIPGVDIIGLRVTKLPKCRSCTSKKQNRKSKIDHKCGRCNAHLKPKQVAITRNVKKRFRCVYCLQCFRKEYCLSFHMDRHNMLSKHKCSLCGSVHITKKLMKVHKSLKYFQCNFCFQRFHTRKNRDMHAMVHIAKSKWRCKDCYKIFPDKKTLVIHSNIKHGILFKRKRKHDDTECDQGLCYPCNNFGSSKQSDTKTCILYEGKQVAPKECELGREAKKMSISKVLIKRIIIEEDKTRHPPTCTTCRIQFSCMLFLQEHNKTYHCLYSCGYCSMQFENTSEYYFHMKLHEYVCGQCGAYGRKMRGGYVACLNHMQTHVLGLRCICGQSFKYLAVSEYEGHVNSCFTCEKCFKQFASKLELEQHKPCHKTNHSLEHLFFCEVCGMSFTSVQECTKHSETHKSECKHFKIKFTSLEQIRANMQFCQYSNRSNMYCDLCKSKISTKNAGHYFELAKSSTMVYACDGCPMYFLQKIRAIEHCMFIHGDASTFRSTSLFTQNSEVVRHNKTSATISDDNVNMTNCSIMSTIQNMKVQDQQINSNKAVFTVQSTSINPNQLQLRILHVDSVEKSGNFGCKQIFTTNSSTLPNHQKDQDSVEPNQEMTRPSLDKSDELCNQGTCDISEVKSHSSQHTCEKMPISFNGDKTAPKERRIPGFEKEKKNASIAKVFNKSIEIEQDTTRHPPSCSSCGKQFDCSIFLQDHNSRIHCSYSCFYCEKEFEDTRAYNSHMKTHNYTCGYCKCEMNSYNVSLKYMQTHELGLRCVCGVSFKYESVSEYETHVKKCFTCELCFSIFNSDLEYINHMNESDTCKDKQGIGLMYFCQFCGKTFTSAQTCTNHSKTHKSDCKHFRIVFSSIVQLRANKQYFLDPNMLSIFCELCNSNISTECAGNYFKLVQRASMIYSCNECSLYFLQKIRAIEHRILVHKDVWNYGQRYYTHNHDTLLTGNRKVDRTNRNHQTRSVDSNETQLKKAALVNVEEAVFQAGNLNSTSTFEEIVFQEQQESQYRKVFKNLTRVVERNRQPLTVPRVKGNSTVTKRPSNNSSVSTINHNVDTANQNHYVDPNEQEMTEPNAANAVGNSSSTQEHQTKQMLFKSSSKTTNEAIDSQNQVKALLKQQAHFGDPSQQQEMRPSVDGRKECSQQNLQQAQNSIRSNHQTYSVDPKHQQIIRPCVVRLNKLRLPAEIKSVNCQMNNLTRNVVTGQNEHHANANLSNRHFLGNTLRFPAGSSNLPQTSTNKAVSFLISQPNQNVCTGQNEHPVVANLLPGNFLGNLSVPQTSTNKAVNYLISQPNQNVCTGQNGHRVIAYLSPGYFIGNLTLPLTFTNNAITVQNQQNQNLVNINENKHPTVVGMLSANTQNMPSWESGPQTVHDTQNIQSNTLSSLVGMEIETNDGTSANCLPTSKDAGETDIDTIRLCVLNDHTYACLVTQNSNNIGDTVVKDEVKNEYPSFEYGLVENMQSLSDNTGLLTTIKTEPDLADVEFQSAIGDVKYEID